MKPHYLSALSVLILASSQAQAEDGSPFFSITLAPYANMNADKDSFGRSEPNSEQFNMNLHQGYGLRAGFWNMYASVTQAQTKQDAELPEARFTTASFGFLTEEAEDTAYPVSLYSRFGAGFGWGKLRYAQGSQEESDLILEAFCEGGVNLYHYYQLGIQAKAQSLFEVGNTRALVGEVALVLSVSF